MEFGAPSKQKRPQYIYLDVIRELCSSRIYHNTKQLNETSPASCSEFFQKHLRQKQISPTWEGGWLTFNPHICRTCWAYTKHEGSYYVELADIWRNNTWASINWSIHLTHRHEYTCTEQVTGHIKQIRTEQFTHRVRVLREEPLRPEWRSFSDLNGLLRFWREML